MKPDQQGVSKVLQDTIRLICSNGLVRRHELHIQGVIAITIDACETFAVHMNETINGESAANLLSDGDVQLADQQNGTFVVVSETGLSADDVSTGKEKVPGRFNRFKPLKERASYSRTFQANAARGRANGRLDFVKHQAKRILASLSMSTAGEREGTSASSPSAECEGQESANVELQKTAAMMDPVEHEEDEENDLNSPMQINDNDNTFAIRDNSLGHCSQILFEGDVKVKTELEGAYNPVEEGSRMQSSPTKIHIPKHKHRQRFKTESAYGSEDITYSSDRPPNVRNSTGYSTADNNCGGKWESHETKPDVNWLMNGWTDQRYSDQSNGLNTASTGVAYARNNSERLSESAQQENAPRVRGNNSGRRTSSEIDMKFNATYGNEAFGNEIISRFVCSYADCGASFTNKPNLLRHQTTKHGREKTYGKRRRNDARVYVQDDYLDSSLYNSFHESSSVGFL